MGEISSQRLIDLANEIGREGGVHSFGVDQVTYDWVKLFAKDRETREEIKRLQGKCIEIQRSPFDKEQLKAAFRENMAQSRQGRLNFLREHIKQAQQQEAKLLSPEFFQPILRETVARIAYLNCDLTDQEIDSLFEGLVQGMTQEEKNKQIVAVEQEIKKLEEMIEKKLSPRERWFYHADGERIPYPRGCRWTWFVKTWEEVCSRYIGPVDIDGYRLEETTEGHAAYELLKLGDVPKRTPIKEGAKR